MRYIVGAVLAGILVLATFNTLSAGPPGITPTVRRLLQTTTTLTGQPLEFPHFRNQVTAVLTELAPGGQTGSTSLFFPSVVYVMEGPLSLEVLGQAARTISAGQALAAPLRTPINSVNRGATSVRFLTVYFGEQGKPLAERASDSSPRGFKTATVLQTAKTWTGEPILFPLLANQFTVQAGEWAPGATVPRHVHPPTQFNYVRDGHITVEASDHPRRTFNRGEAFVETTLPHFGANRGAGAAAGLAILAGEAGVPLNVPVP
jgi:quercetin dioxygenase-like cupin family protein